LVSKGGSLYTISREDIYDYFRCPKIVSIKAFERKIRPNPYISEKTNHENQYANVIGKIGEYASELTFANQPLSANENGIKIREELIRRGFSFDEELKKILKETLDGLREIKPYIEATFGSINIIGKGESRYSSMPCWGKPDFVAVNSTNGKPLLVEIKNTKKKNIDEDTFQAKFYNSLEETVGIVILENRLEGKKRVLKPKTINYQNSETLIVYPRLGEVSQVSEPLEFNIDIIKEAWRAKQLGFQGLWPATDCSFDCPHKRFSTVLKEGNMEVVKPLPLILAKGMDECGEDLDANYWRRYLGKITPHTMMQAKYQNDKEAQEKLATYFNLEKDELKRIISKPISSFSESDKLMSNETEQWNQLLPNNLSIEHARGVSTQAYPLPKDSSHNLKKCWKEWE
jgi:hypothetical protein